MELVKFIVESYVQFIGHIAWPVAIVVILFVFRGAIIDKLRGLTEFGGLGVDAKFALNEAEKKITKKLKFSEITKKELTWDSYLDVLEDVGFWIDISISLLFTSYLSKSIPKEDFEKMYQVTTNQIDDIGKKIETERPDSTVVKAIRENQIKLKEKIELFERLSKPKRSRANFLL